MKLRAGSQRNHAFKINHPSEAQIHNAMPNRHAHKASNFGTNEADLQTLSGTRGANPTLLTNEILVKSMHTSASGSEALNTKLANKLKHGYETLSQRNYGLLDGQERKNPVLRHSANPRFARTGLSSYQSTAFQNTESQGVQDSQNFFSHDVNKQMLQQEPKYIAEASTPSARRSRRPESLTRS